jgi:hypothetical protein
MTNDNEYREWFASVVDRLPMSDADKVFLKTTNWTFDETPEITSAEQYDAYAKVVDGIYRSAGIPPGDSPERARAFVAHSRTREGMLANALGARMIEWEERNEVHE